MANCNNLNFLKSFWISFKHPFRDFISYAKSHKILVQTETRLDGISYTLIGWALIALATIVFQDSTLSVPPRINFLILFISGSLFLFFLGSFKSISFFKIQEFPDIQRMRGDRPYLNPYERIGLIIVRSIIAVLGYEFYSLARVFTTAVDNSVAFGADALVYACLIRLILGIKISRRQWIGVIITTSGIITTYILSSMLLGPLKALPGLSEGIGSSIALALIILVNSVLIQHDPPLRVAFYQCLIGAFIFTFLISFFSPQDFLFFKILISDEAGARTLSYLAMQGICYAVALLCFFRAFLFTEPMVIASLGYSLAIFLSVFSFLINKEFPKMIDFILNAIISVGCLIIIKSEYADDKNRAKINSHGAHYIPNLLEKMFLIIESFKNKTIDWSEYMSRIHEYNKLLFGFSQRIKDTLIQKIEISTESVFFEFKEPKLKITTDGACRSAPFEILNFGFYELEESIIYKMITDGDQIFDIGAHIGWLSLNLSLRFPKSIIYAFEPISDTFYFLEKNIKTNKVKNINYFNLGLSNSEREADFYYFKGGSVLSSEKNLINHQKYKVKSVHLTTFDHFVKRFNIDAVDFLKCDVEGAELFVLIGAKNAIMSFLPIIYMEIYEPWCKKFDYSSRDILKFLGELNYECYFSEKERLYKIDQIPEDTDSYNYFFFHPEKHKKILEKFC